MAKTTSKTQAKTKTTNKKPAAKSTAKAAKPVAKATKTSKAMASKSVKKVAAKTPTKTTKSTIKAAEAPKVAKVNNGVTPLLNRIQVQLGIVFAVLAGLAAYFVNTSSVQVFLGHLTKDELASTSGTVLAPAAHVLYEVDFRWLIVGFLVLAAIIAVLRGTRYLSKESAAVSNKTNTLRWIDYALTSSVAFSIVALLNGVQDLVALKLSAIAIIVAAYLAWVFERENAVTKKPTRSIYVVSALLTVIPVVFLIVTMISTYVYGTDGASVAVRSPWYAYAAAAVVSISLLATTRMQWNGFKKGYDFGFVNRNFNRLSVVTKLLLVVILIVGLQK